MSTAIDQAVMAALLADSQLETLAPGRVFADVAPEGVDDPFVIVTLQAHEDVPEQTARIAYEAPRYLVKVVGQGLSATAAVAAYNRCHALLQNVALTIAGFHWMGTTRESRIKYVEADGPVYWQHVGGIYRVEADPS